MILSPTARWGSYGLNRETLSFASAARRGLAYPLSRLLQGEICRGFEAGDASIRKGQIDRKK